MLRTVKQFRLVMLVVLAPVGTGSPWNRRGERVEAPVDAASLVEQISGCGGVVDGQPYRHDAAAVSDIDGLTVIEPAASLQREILKRGRVRLFRVSPDGRALTTAINTPGTIFLEMVLVGQQMHDNWAEALEEALVCVMARNDVHTFLLATRASPAASSASTPT